MTCYHNPDEDSEYSENWEDGAYSLHTFAGLTLAPLTLVSTYRVRTCFGVGRFAGGVKMYAWRCMFNGRKYHGRNGGPMMVVHMRCTTRVKHTQMG